LFDTGAGAAKQALYEADAIAYEESKVFESKTFWERRFNGIYIALQFESSPAGSKVP
jgi:hypothetical protein